MHVPVPAQGCAGSLVSSAAYSPDGLAWARTASAPFGNAWQTASGRNVTVATRERPKFGYDAQGRPVVLYTAVSSLETCPGRISCVACKDAGWSYTQAALLKFGPAGAGQDGGAVA